MAREIGIQVRNANMIPRNIVTAASFTPNSLQSPNAWVGHLPFAAWVIQELSPKIFVELGTHSGNSYFAFCQSVAEAGLPSKCFAVDTWQGDEHAGQYNDEIFANVNAHHQERYAGFSRLLRMSFDDALTYFADESIELLHIDGLHTYEAVRHDFETWLPKLAPGAVVMLHDTNVRERNFGVWKLWEELQAHYPNNLEFVHSHGLGVLQLNNAPDDNGLGWLQPNSPEKQQLVKYFAALGSRQLERFELHELKQHAANLREAVANRDGQIASLSQGITERDGQITSLSQGITERDGQIASLSQGITEREGQITSLSQGITERDGQITSLSQGITERDGQITSLSQGITERDGQIASLSQGITERDGQIASLSQGITERDGQIASLNQAAAEREAYIEKIVGSKSWLITKPFRWFGRVCRGEFEAAIDPFKKGLGLSSKTGTSRQVGSQVIANSSEAFITSSPIKPTHPTAVILPVYRGIEMTKRCILAAMPSVLADPYAKLLAINDASPNEGMQEMLEKLATEWPDRLLVLKNENNLGFVRTVNRGLAYFSQYDVVLLNSDVIVPKDWLSRLTDEAYSRGNVGTVTPFSNNATICSFPYFLQENAQPFDLDVDFVNSVFRHEKLPCIEAPTGVGFFMYIRRACLEKIGYLNEDKFGRGYGEENDLCQRALKSGWLNLISPNMYAFHEGGVSFSSDKQALVDRAMQVLDELHPNYHADIQKFIKDDPVKSARVARYAQLLATIPVPKVLHISHSVGGGVKQHIEELAQYFDPCIANILLAPQGNNGEVCIRLGIAPHADSLSFCMPSGYADIVKLLKAVGVSAVHFHHTHGLNPRILQLATDLEVARILTVHDFYWLGANPTLTDENGKYPGFYSDQLHNPLYPLPPGMTVQKWQDPLRTFIEGADCVIYPSNSTKFLFEHVYHPSTSVVAPHIEQQLNVNTPPDDFTEKASYTIGVLGAIGPEKGADLLEEIATRAKGAGLDFRFKLIGYAYRPLSSVETTGPYETKDLKDLIHKHELDMVFFTAQCPETYSYTLSYALDSGLPIVAPSIGAFPERLSGRPNTMLFNHLRPVPELLDQLNAFVEQISKKGAVKAPVFENDKSKHDFYSNDYLNIVSHDLKIVGVGNLKRFGLNSARIISSGLKNKNSTWRETLVHLLWQLHMNPHLRWISRAIPHKVRRAVRCSLSNGNSHDIARGSKGK